MSGFNYQISFSLSLESERRLQLSNILKVFNLKHSSTPTESTVSLKEFLNKFTDNYDCLTLEQLDIEHYLTKFNQISSPVIDVFQTECLVYIAGYAVFSYFKKSIGCRTCHGLLTSENS